jgi:hypothetical protein
VRLALVLVGAAWIVVARASADRPAIVTACIGVAVQARPSHGQCETSFQSRLTSWAKPCLGALLHTARHWSCTRHTINGIQRKPFIRQARIGPW